MTLRVGLVGAGMVSRHHLIAWSRLRPGAEVVAIADPDAGHAAARAAEFGVARTYADAGAMLDAERLDAIDVAAPRQVHVELVRLGVARGLAVLCQKPLAPTLAEAQALVAETAGARLMVHENWRFRRYYRDAARWIAAGTIGAVQQCEVRLLTSGLLPDAGGARPALVRQPFMQHEPRMLVNEVLIHHLDTLRVLLGPLRVTAARLGRSCADMAGEDNALITLAAESGAGAVVLGNIAVPGLPATQADEMLVLGTAGAIRLAGSRLERTGPQPGAIEYDLAECYQGSYDAAIAHFVACLDAGGRVRDHARGRPAHPAPGGGRLPPVGLARGVSVVPEELAGIVTGLEDDIIFGRLPPGRRLVEDALMARFNATRHAIRQALVVLEGRGIVTRERNVGAAVRAYDRDEVLEIYQVRELLQRHAALMVRLPADPALLERLERLNERFRGHAEACDLRGVHESNDAFHLTLFGACGNAHLVGSIAHYMALSLPMRATTLADAEAFRTSLRQHEAMIGLLRGTDAWALAQLCVEHVWPSKRDYLQRAPARAEPADAAGCLRPRARPRRTGMADAGR